MDDRPNGSTSAEYTDGASPVEIQNALRSQGSSHGRGESQISSLYMARRSMSSFRDDNEGGGSIFDGPGSVTIPSSVTGLKSSSHNRSRRNSRVVEPPRVRTNSNISRQSFNRRETNASGTAITDSDEEQLVVSPTRISRGRKLTNESFSVRSPGEEGNRRSVFGNIANFFVRRESPSRISTTSRSRRGSNAGDDATSSVDDDDRWGYVSEDEEPSEDEAATIHSSIYPSSSRGSFSRPPSPSGSLPGMGRDPIFGDTRIDMGEFQMNVGPTNVGPPNSQDIYISDEDVNLRLRGYEIVRWRQLVWRAATILSLGLLGLFGYWFPKFWLRWVAIEKPFSKARVGLVVVEVSCSL